jgi:hypothetical protein
MYRSSEIIKILSKKNLPEEIVKHILSYERILLFNKSIYQWLSISYQFHTERMKLLFYLDIKSNFLNEIYNINGDFDYLKQYKSRLYDIKLKNKNDALYLNSLRY